MYQLNNSNCSIALAIIVKGIHFTVTIAISFSKRIIQISIQILIGPEKHLQIKLNEYHSNIHNNNFNKGNTTPNKRLHKHVS